MSLRARLSRGLRVVATALTVVEVTAVDLVRTTDVVDALRPQDVTANPSTATTNSFRFRIAISSGRSQRETARHPRQVPRAKRTRKASTSAVGSVPPYMRNRPRPSVRFVAAITVVLAACSPAKKPVVFADLDAAAKKHLTTLSSGLVGGNVALAASLSSGEVAIRDDAGARAAGEREAAGNPNDFGFDVISVTSHPLDGGQPTSSPSRRFATGRTALPPTSSSSTTATAK